jgi:SAM-dependent methyltransferase
VSEDKGAALRELLAGRTATSAVVEATLSVWPEHAAYLLRSFQRRSPSMMDTTELAAAAARRLMAGAETTFAADYRWTCDKLREEELFFHREGRYRLSTFAEADAEVYSDAEYMGHYVNGLLLSQLLWYNHAGVMEMFLNRLLPSRSEPFDYLEIGPGHGLMVYFAAGASKARSLEAWDVSEVSLRETDAALKRLDVAKPVRLTRADILGGETLTGAYDVIVASEVLEHLEDPAAAIARLASVLKPGGSLFLSLPINSPSPDHIYLFEGPDDVRSLVEGAGLRIAAMELFATQGRPIEAALASRISISAGVIAEPA